MTAVTKEGSEIAADDGAAQTLTPTFGQTLRRWRFWVVTIAVVVAAVVLYSLFASGGRDMRPFGAGNAGPSGGRALVEVLRSQGVDVRVATSIGQVEGAGTPANATTLLVSDTDGLLDAERIERLRSVADTVVIVGPDTALLDVLAPEVALGGTPDSSSSTAAAGDACDVPAATRAGSITLSGASLQPSGAGDSGRARFCFTDPGGRSQLAVVSDGERTVSVMAASTAFENGTITTAGNAALALGLLGSTPTLVWYEPGLGDVAPGATPPTTADLTPEWVSPVLALLLAALIAAAVWRGRRLGPLVVENLPVVVRAGETIEGRARLYRRASVRLHTLDALRMGSVRRLAIDLGLPRSADVDAVVSAVATRLGRSEAAVRALLLDDVPGTDAELIDAGRALLDLERDVKATIAGGAS